LNDGASSASSRNSRKNKDLKIGKLKGKDFPIEE
jgi:hypothetical protein